MLYLSYLVSWAITGGVHVVCFLFIRKKAYAKIDARSPYHPDAKGHELPQD